MSECGTASLSSTSSPCRKITFCVHRCHRAGSLGHHRTVASTWQIGSDSDGDGSPAFTAQHRSRGRGCVQLWRRQAGSPELPLYTAHTLTSTVQKFRVGKLKTVMHGGRSDDLPMMSSPQVRRLLLTGRGTLAISTPLAARPVRCHLTQAVARCPITRPKVVSRHVASAGGAKKNSTTCCEGQQPLQDANHCQPEAWRTWAPQQASQSTESLVPMKRSAARQVCPMHLKHALSSPYAATPTRSCACAIALVARQHKKSSPYFRKPSPAHLLPSTT